MAQTQTNFYLYDKQFKPNASPSGKLPPSTQFKFVYLINPRDVKHLKDITMCFYTDQYLSVAKHHNTYKFKKIAWVREPQSIHKYPYEYLLKHHEDFDIVILNNKTYLSRIPNSIYIPNIMTFLRHEDIQLYPNKHLNLSIVCSDKMTTSGHRFRHSIVKLLKANKRFRVDKYGKMVNNFVENKIDTLKNYKFQIVLENSKIDGYFSEKIIDCFLTGTIPIYWGTDTVYSYYDKRAIINFNNGKELIAILQSLKGRHAEVYRLMYPAIINNFGLATRYLSQEYVIYDKYLKPSQLPQLNKKEEESR